jgi:hypothetical protein
LFPAIFAENGSEEFYLMKQWTFGILLNLNISAKINTCSYFGEASPRSAKSALSPALFFYESWKTNSSHKKRAILGFLLFQDRSLLSEK